MCVYRVVNVDFGRKHTIVFTCGKATGPGKK